MNLENLFLSLGYTKEEYNQIISTHSLRALKKETLYNKVLENYRFLLSVGYTREEVIKMTKNSPVIYGCNIENIKQKILDIMSLGYTREEVIKMTKTLPSIYGLSIENIKRKIEDMISLGYTREEVIKMTKSLSTLYGYNIENIRQKILDIMSLGYTREEVIKMTKTLPSIYGLSIENMKQKIIDIMSLGYTREEVIKMTKSLPTLYGYSIENIRQKIKFYDSIDMHDLAVNDSKQLMQSVDLSYARYAFYMEIGEGISMSNYRNLFINNKEFEKKYGITKKELLEKYNYKKYMEEQKDKTI